MSTYSDRLYDHFQRERTVFNRYVLAMVSLGVFFLLVFEPYLATVTRLVRLDRDLSVRSERIADAQQKLDDATAGIERATTFMGDASDYRRLYEETDSWITDLDEIEQGYDNQARLVAALRDALNPGDQRSWRVGSVPGPRIVETLHEARPELMQSYRTGDNCFFLVEEAWVRCQVDRRLASIRQRLERVLYDRTASYEYTRRLRDNIDANRSRYEKGIAHALQRGELGALVRQYLDEEQQIIRNWYESMARERSRLNREAKEQQTRLATIEAERKQVESRQAEIRAAGHLDSPVGQLPLSFHDLLGLVPLLLLSTAALLLRSQRRLLMLRSSFEEHGQGMDNDPDALKLTLPLWLDPAGGRGSRWLAHGFFQAPAAAALVATVQLMAQYELLFGHSRAKAAGILIATIVALCVYAVLYIHLEIARRRAPRLRG